MAGVRHGMCELTRHGIAGEQHGHGMVCMNRPYNGDDRKNDDNDCGGYGVGDSWWCVDVNLMN